MAIAVKANTKAGFYNAVDGTVEVDSIVSRWPYSGFETPAELTGTSAISVPTYNGIEQLLVLDKNWAVVMIDFTTDLFTEINTLSGGTLQTDYDSWLAAVRDPPLVGGDFVARGDMWDTRLSYIGQARDNIGELTMETTGAWEITSADDTNYSSAQNPTEAHRYCYSAGADTVYRPALLPDVDDAQGGAQNGFTQVGYFACGYIKFPTALLDGDTYTITILGKSVTFLFDRTKTISRSIKINQEGYFSDATSNKAFMGAHLYEGGPLDLSHATSFEVINAATGGVALSGTPALQEANPAYSQTGRDSGTTTGTAANKLIDSSQNFKTTVSIGDRVFNTTDTTEANVTAVDSDTQLSLSADIMTSGETYGIGEPMYGEDIYEMDFSALATTGTFYISVPGVGRSWPFEHTTSAWDYAAYTMARGFYHHRAGVELTTKHSYWARRKAKMGPYLYLGGDHMTFPKPTPNVPAGYDVFDTVEAGFDPSQPIADVVGGHHDAADWDRNTSHLKCATHMLYAFQFNTNLTNDGWLDLPDAGNGIPDVLKEVRHQLELYRLTQDSGTGGIYSFLETWTHPKADHGAYDDGLPWRKAHYALGPLTRWNSLMYAGVAARYARLVQIYDAAESTLYRDSAIDAYNFGNNPANSLGTHTIRDINDPSRTWDELDSMSDVFLMDAKCQLYLLTGTTSYITDSPSVATIEARVGSPWAWQFTEYDDSGWFWYSIIEVDDDGYIGLGTQATTWRSWFESRADGIEANISLTPYEVAMGRTEGPQRWALSVPHMNAPALIIAHQTSGGAAKYRDALIKNMDYMLGANGLGMSWCTGVGQVYPVFINMNFSREMDNIMDPVPGVTVYGVTTDDGFGGGGANFETEVWRATLPGDGAVTSITQTGGTATVTTTTNHGLTTGDRIEILSATESEYNVAGVCTVTGVNTFEYEVDSGATSPATGTPIAYRDFSYPSHRHPAQPKWRRFMQHPSNNVPQCEYTIHETMASMTLAALYLYSGSSVTQRTPRDPDYLWGRWILP